MPNREANYRNLVAAVLNRAVQDYADKPRHRPSISKFFKSDWCGTLCDAIDFPRDLLQHDTIIEASRRRARKRCGPNKAAVE